ncbi:MAG TPA: R2-like ligand-binding oxidase [Thermoanaerobaculia bacterium]|nr:R2-like ligand-binding oxidase [Thermoanaerobaculia bacterium]
MTRIFQVTGPRGLDHDSPPMRLWHKAKQRGVWDPRSIDFSRDREDWLRLSDLERDVLLRLTSLFAAGEESVALDLLPLIQTIAAEGRLEEEMYLAAFLWEEAKHVELFRRFVDEVAEEASDLSRYHTPSYRRVFYEELPTALGRLRDDPSPEAQAAASVTYNMIVEGVLAETGYHGYHQILVRNELMPGMQQAVAYLKADEARHMAYGVFLLSRLVAEHGEPVWAAIEARMGELLAPALGVIEEVFEAYDEMPFGLTREDFSGFALTQFQRRSRRIELARGKSLEEIAGAPLDDDEAAA